ncbi:putative serine/threonine-protein kinase-like protein CCR3 [Ananas comosus]|uniref:Putative serine/threonine-protein kinase-like protein CCR3 n=1 Tax=Ananas comosus TaxID=4615 RepID=A0A199VBN7_ANACO|nr:putative serine/threonine-protein kinase-like protein CCR3 [Ananas comosus]
MRIRFSNAATVAAESILVVVVVVVLAPSPSHALGSASTLAIAYGSATVCGVAAGTSPRSVYCSAAGGGRGAEPLSPNLSFDSVSGGRDFLCGLRSGGAAFFCWNGVGGGGAGPPRPKRVYNGPDALAGLAVGVDQIAAVDRNASRIEWWRGGAQFPRSVPGSYRSLTSGDGFSCAIAGNGTVGCWGPRGGAIQALFSNLSMASIVAGDSHVCGVDAAGFLLCRGSNASGQSDPPRGSAFEFSGLALGSNHTCALRRPNNTVLCWGGFGGGPAANNHTPANATEFALVVAGGNLTCGVTTSNFSVVCWRSDWRNSSVTTLPLPTILPGICAAQQSDCNCGIYPDSGPLCSGSGVVCNQCGSGAAQPPPPPPPPPPPQSASAPSSSSKKRVTKGWLAFGIVGGVGCFAGACTLLYWLWRGVCGHKKVHNSVQPTIAAASRSGGGANAAESAGAGAGAGVASPFTSPSGSKSRIFRRQGSRVMRRQRSGPSSFKDHRAEEFTFPELAAATKNFSMETKIGAGSFGTVYKGKLPDGREVAIKRSESGPRSKKFQEKESAFQSELAFLSRLHHKHLVGLLGYCEEKEERLLVYEFMKNGALYDHLHSKDASAALANSVVRSSWKVRIKVLLDASRGIEYLHNYAVPPIIHRDIKSSNILLDSNWVARVSDFGLSLMGPDSEGGHLSMKAAGTVGYMDPEYYGLQHLTVKSDVYGFGVVMLEVLTGRRAIFKDEGGNPVSVVDFAVPSIVAGNVRSLLDERPGPLGPHEAEAVELVAYTAVHCVSLEGRERPAMTDVVANLETAVALLENSHGSISSASISLASVD